MATKENVLVDLLKENKTQAIQKMLDMEVITPEYLEEVLKNEKNGYFIYQVMQNIKGIDIVGYWHTLISIRNWYYLTEAVKNIPGVPEVIATEAIMNSDDIEAIYYYAKEIPNVDVNRFVLKAISLKTKYLNQKGYFTATLLKMASLKNAPIEKIAHEVFADDNFMRGLDYLQENNMALYPIAEGLRCLVKEKINRGENAYCHYLIIFARNVSNVYATEFAQTVVETDDAAWILMFAQSVPNAPMELLTEAIIATHDLEYMRIFRDYNFKGASLEKLNAEIEKLEVLTNMETQKNLQKLHILEFLLEKNSQVILDENRDYFESLLPDEASIPRKRKKYSTHKN